MTKRRRPDFKVIFAAEPRLIPLLKDIGDVIVRPISPSSDKSTAHGVACRLSVKADDLYRRVIRRGLALSQKALRLMIMWTMMLAA